MRIGIDAKWYWEGPPSGRRVVRALVDQIAMNHDDHEYFFILNSQHRDRPFPHPVSKRIHVRYVWAGNNLISNLLVVPRLSRRENLDVVLYQNFISPFDSACAVAYIHDVLFLSNPEFYTIFERLYFFPLKFLTKWAGHVVTVSHEEKERLIRFGFCPGNKVTVAHHGVDGGFRPLAEFDPAQVDRVKKQFNLPDEFLLFVGRLNLRKNVDNLLRATPHLKNKKIPLVIVGADNWKKSNHEALVKELAVENRILFTGGIYEDLGVVYALAKVFCFPSHAESFGLPPLEAMACGIPVVVSNTTSLPEICGEAAIYANPEKPLEIARGIDSLLDNDLLYNEQKRKGIEQASMFTWKNAVSVIVDCLENCVNRLKS